MKLFTAARHRSEIELSLSEPAVAPPMSLSAPELGSDEPFEMPLMRNAVSSSELLHEKAMARLYQDAAEEEMIKVQLRKKSLERRGSLREVDRKQNLREIALERRNSLKEQKNKEDRMTSVEREQIEFAKIRERLKNEKTPEVRNRPTNLKQESTISSQLSSGSENVSIEEELEEEEDYLEEEEVEEEEEDEKPPVPMHGILKNAPKAEEETYHPRSMVPTRGIVRALPVIVDEDEPKIPTITLNEEEEIKQDEPVKLPEKKKKSKLFKKINFGRKKDKTPLILDMPLPSIKLPKPILKKRSTRKKEKKDSPPIGDDVKKKQVRISEPGLEVPVNDDPKLSPRSEARKQRIQRRQQSLEEEEQANKVFIYHYSDIVKEFGGPKKVQPKLYLDIQELEAHADQIPEVQDEPEVDETLMPSDQEERGSAPDISEVDSEVNISELESEERTHSPSPLVVKTPRDVRSTMDYLTDVAIFLFACWLYLFKNELYVIPVLVLLVFRQLQELVREKYLTWKASIERLIPNRVKRIISKD